MIAADTNSLTAYFKGESGADVDRIDLALVNGELRFRFSPFCQTLRPDAGVIAAYCAADLRWAFWINPRM